MKPILTAAFALALFGALCVSDRPAPVGAETRSTTRTSTSGDGYTYGTWSSNDGQGPNDEFEYALVAPGGNSDIAMSNVHLSSRIGALQRDAERLGHRVWWFRLDDRSYVVRDRELTERAHAILRPIEELGARQGRLGAQQGQWGAMQGRLGAIQGRIGALQAQLALATAFGGPASEADRRDTEDLQRQVRELSAQARDLGAEQRDLGDRQRALGHEQGELGRKQAAASKDAQRDLMELAKEAVASGRAERD